MFNLSHRNVNSNTGKNIRFIEDLIGIDIFDVNIKQLKQKVKFSPCPNDEQWRVNFLKEIVNIKQNVYTLHENDANLSLSFR